MEDVKVFVVEVLEDTEINGASYEKGRRLKFDNKIPDHIQEVIDAGNAEDITSTLTADQIAVADQAENPVEPVEVPVDDPKDPASEASSTPGSEADTSTPTDPDVATEPVSVPVVDDASLTPPATPMQLPTA